MALIFGGVVQRENIGFAIRKRRFNSARLHQRNLMNPKKPRKPCPECGLTVENYRSKFCSRFCFDKNQFDFRYTKWLAGEGGWNDQGARPIRTLLIKLRGHRCESCKNTEWMGKPVPLQLDHSDGNSQNQAPDNLRLLCPNCHAMTPTYGNRNVGNGRLIRRLRLQKQRAELRQLESN